MRYGSWILLALCLLLVAGCEREEEPAGLTPPISVLVFRYDALRDVVIASSVRGRFPSPVPPQSYAEALQLQPEVSYAPSPELQISDPLPQVKDRTLTVNYRRATNLEQLASAQVAAVLAAVEAWWWTPDIAELRILAEGEPLTTLGPLALTQPLRRSYHTYVVQPETSEVGYLTGSLMPTTLAQAVEYLQQREIRSFPASQGFQPLLPPDTTAVIDTEKMTSGVLTVDLPADFPREDGFRLAGITLMLTQFPEVESVRFTFGGLVVNAPFMRGNLNAPVSPYLLLLPADVGQVASEEATVAIRASVRDALGREPVAYGIARTWRDWAVITAVPEAGASTRTFVMRRQQGMPGYTVQHSGDDVTVAQLQANNIPREVIVAFRLPGWEQFAL